MKTLLIFLMAFLPMNDSINETIDVTVTVYNPELPQCYGDPLKTADGSIIDLEKLDRREIRWIAVSQDLLDTFWFGDEIEIISDEPLISGVYEVHDVMPKKWSKKVDILMPHKIKKGKWTAKIRKYETPRNKTKRK